jgi:hypothetical protein
MKVAGQGGSGPGCSQYLYQKMYIEQSMLYFNAMDKKWDGIGIATPEEEARLIELKGDRTDMHGEQ